MFIQGDPVGDLLITGSGAGAGPTASAVVADLIDLAQHKSHREEAYLHLNKKADLAIADLTEDTHTFYLRVEIKNESGILAKITRILAEKHVNIESILQKEDHQESAVVIVITNQIKEAVMQDCLAVIKNTSAVRLVKSFRVHNK